jgi:anti-sigma factor RsiW
MQAAGPDARVASSSVMSALPMCRLDVESTSAHTGPIWKVCGKGLKREQNPARLAARDGELIAGRRQLIRRSG